MQVKLNHSKTFIGEKVYSGLCLAISNMLLQTLITLSEQDNNSKWIGSAKVNERKIAGKLFRKKLENFHSDMSYLIMLNLKLNVLEDKFQSWIS